MNAGDATGKRRARVLIVDDHPVVRRGLAELIGDDPDLEVCGQAAGVAEALRLVESTSPDLIVVDITLKDGSGLNLMRQVKAERPSIKLLAASMHDEGLFARRAFNAGAAGYIGKGQALHEVRTAIHQVLQGNVYMSAQLAQSMMQNPLMDQQPLGRLPVDSLSDRELEVFKLIGEGMGTRQIAERLHLSHKTIETHRDNIKKKLNVETGPELVRHAMRWIWEQTG